MRVLIRYRVKADQVSYHLELLRAVHQELAELRPENVREAVFRLDDPGEFVHLVEVDPGPEVLAPLAAFQRYRSTLDERCDEPPVLTVLHDVAAYRFPAPAPLTTTREERT
ncbi:hypothetical protein Sru01_47550 [Sphaerisporangium rufum]|uniref:Uncharacterized protein n=1 Tax=Sphaerisporangium rufum TaxID=1381558 RepID=A0A919R5R1_9ACTN|nr:hypothetical protein [Sphaerisporangium rufum]GII79773.1 hypothetical protein Sru01_47550 [Sphaerisporangium rufum]